VGEKDITNFHVAEWVPGGFVCTPTTLEFPTINHTNILCFESHLMCGLDLLAILACCESVGSAFLRTLLFYGTFIPRLIMSISCFMA
jgi:hypothetical protein